MSKTPVVIELLCNMCGLVCVCDENLMQHAM